MRLALAQIGYAVILLLSCIIPLFQAKISGKSEIPNGFTFAPLQLGLAFYEPHAKFDAIPLGKPTSLN